MQGVPTIFCWPCTFFGGVPLAEREAPWEWRQKALLEFCALLRLHNRPSVVQKGFAFEGYKETWDWLVGKYTLPRTRMARGIRGRRPTSQEVQLVPVPGSLPRTPPQAEQAGREAEEAEAEGAPPPEEAEERHEAEEGEEQRPFDIPSPVSGTTTPPLPPSDHDVEEGGLPRVCLWGWVEEVLRLPGELLNERVG